MASTYTQPGRRMNHTNATSTAIASGDVVVVGTRIGIAIADIAVGSVGALAMAGVHKLLATVADSWAAGATLYWNATTEMLTDTAAANPVAGIAWAAKLALATTATVLVNGIPEA